MRNDFSGINVFDNIYSFNELDSLEHQYLPTVKSILKCRIKPR